MARQAWRNSTWQERRKPAGWAALRKEVLERDGKRCVKCGSTATEVDHIDGRGSDAPSNLQSLCRLCHQHKTSSTGGKATAAKRREISQRFRFEDRHPGTF